MVAAASLRKKASKPRKPTWDSDSQQLGGLSSFEVLLEWMRTAGNVQLWYTKGRQNEAVHEILRELKKNGISHRTERSIKCKVRHQERQYASVMRWLEANQLRVDNVLNDKTSNGLLATVLEKCPLFCELLPVLGPLTEKTKPRTRNMKIAACKKRKADDEARCLSNARSQSATGLVPDLVSKTEPGTDNSERDVVTFGANMFDSDVCMIEFSPERQQKIAMLKLEHMQKSSESVLETNKKRRLSLLEIEVAKCEAMAKSEVEKHDVVAKLDVKLKKRLNHLSLRREMAKARFELKKDGVPDEVIDFGK
ncbi:hypothetical protein PC128_g10148 [Phytophthora cactorum]|nr:hypothetical protein PC128_g10148 [Phytophthora cactorum]